MGISWNGAESEMEDAFMSIGRDASVMAMVEDAAGYLWLVVDAEGGDGPRLSPNPIPLTLALFAFKHISPYNTRPLAVPGPEIMAKKSASSSAVAPASPAPPAVSGTIPVTPPPPSAAPEADPTPKINAYNLPALKAAFDQALISVRHRPFDVLAGNSGPDPLELGPVLISRA